MLIGLTGYARTGKDEVGRYLVSTHDYSRRAFADPMRAAALALDPIVDFDAAGNRVRLSEVVETHGWEKAKSLTEVRRTLQRLGTEAGRDVHGEDVWVTATFRTIHPASDIVITDVRFPNEADAIEDAGGIMVRVIRPGITSLNAHISEASMDDYLCPYTIENFGTLSDLADSVEMVLDDMAKVSTRRYR